MRKYTVSIHVQRLKMMLKKDNPCQCCPAAWRLNSGFSAGDLWNSKASEVCTICREFVGLNGNGLCPCFVLKKETIPITLKAIKEYDNERNR